MMKRSAVQTMKDRKMKKLKCPDAADHDWTMAPDRAGEELRGIMPRMRQGLVVGTNSVSRGLEKGRLRFVVLRGDIGPKGSRSHIPELAYRGKVPFVVSSALRPCVDGWLAGFAWQVSRVDWPHLQDQARLRLWHRTARRQR